MTDNNGSQNVVNVQNPDDFVGAIGSGLVATIAVLVEFRSALINRDPSRLLDTIDAVNQNSLNGVKALIDNKSFQQFAVEGIGGLAGAKLFGSAAHVLKANPTTVAVSTVVGGIVGSDAAGKAYTLTRDQLNEINSAVKSTEETIVLFNGNAPENVIVGLGLALVLQKLNATGLLDDRKEEIDKLIGEVIDQLPEECFLADTPIDMWPKEDGEPWQKRIKDVTLEDTVVSYEDDGSLVPGRVTRTYVNQVKRILNVFGLMVTPGHVTLCGDGKFAGQHVPIIDILRSDGSLVLKDGQHIRGATGLPVGSEGDRMICAIAGPVGPDGKCQITETGQIRLGTRIILDDGQNITVWDIIRNLGAIITDDGYLASAPGSEPGSFHWTFSPMLPKPEDYVLKRSGLTLDALYEADEWEAMGPQVPPPYRGEAGPSFNRPSSSLHAVGAGDAIPPNVPLEMSDLPQQPTMSRKQRRAQEKKIRKVAKAKKPLAKTGS